MSRIASAIGVPIFADECTTKQTRISYARMLVEVNVTKSIPQKITVVDPYGKTFLQDVVLEWKPQYCDKCQKIGHVCQVENGLNEEIMKKRRPGKKVTQTWQYKGPISQKSELEKKEEHSQEMRMRAQEEEQISEIVQTPKSNAVQGHSQLELSLDKFPILKPIATRNGFESLMSVKSASFSVDRGGAPKSC